MLSSPIILQLIFMIEIYECFSSDTLNDFFFYIFFVRLYQLYVVLFQFSSLLTTFYTLNSRFFLLLSHFILFLFLFFCYLMLMYILSVRSKCVYVYMYIVSMAHNDNNLESHFQYHWMIYVMLVVGHCLTSVSTIQYCWTFNMLKSSLFSIRPSSQSKITFVVHKHLDKVKMCLKIKYKQKFRISKWQKEERKYSNMDNIINHESMEEGTWYTGS